MRKIIFICLFFIGIALQNTAFASNEYIFFDDNHNLLVKYQDINEEKKIFKSDGKNVTFLKLNKDFRLFYNDKFFEVINLKNQKITYKFFRHGAKFKSAEVDENDNVIIYLEPPKDTSNFIIKDEVPHIIIQPDGKAIDRDKFTLVYSLIKIDDKHYSVESYTPTFYSLLEIFSGNKDLRLPRSLFLYEIKDDKVIYKEFIAPYFGYSAHGFRGDFDYTLDGKKLDIRIKRTLYKSKFDIQVKRKTIKLNKKFKPRTLWGKIDEIRGKIPRFYELIVASKEPIAKVSPESYTCEDYSTYSRPEITNLQIHEIRLSENFTTDEKNNKYYIKRSDYNRRGMDKNGKSTWSPIITMTKKSPNNNLEWIDVIATGNALYILYFKDFENPKLYQYKDGKLYFMKEFNTNIAQFKNTTFRVIVSCHKKGWGSCYMYNPETDMIEFKAEPIEKSNFKQVNTPSVMNLIKNFKKLAEKIYEIDTEEFRILNAEE